MAVTSVTSNGKALIIVDGSSTYNLQKKDVFSLNTNAGIVYVDTTTKGVIYVPTSVATQAQIQAFLDALSDLGTVDVGNFPAVQDVNVTNELTVSNEGLASEQGQYDSNTMLWMIYNELVELNRIIKKIYS